MFVSLDIFIRHVCFHFWVQYNAPTADFRKIKNSLERPHSPWGCIPVLTPVGVGDARRKHRNASPRLRGAFRGSLFSFSEIGCRCIILHPKVKTDVSDEKVSLHSHAFFGHASWRDLTVPKCSRLACLLGGGLAKAKQFS